MVSTGMAAQKQDRSQEEQFDVFVRLPCGTTAPVAVRYDMIIFELKSMIEFTFGVPVEMQKLAYKHRLLYNDDETIRTCIVIPGVRITVGYPYGWEELIEASLAGDTKSVINDIYHHFDKSIIARRRFIVVFISSHKGYGFLVERMLSDGMNPNAQTATGRTALHIAGAMGMMNCINLLLQHHASVDIKDKFGFTPQQLADRCGQTDVNSKLVQFRQIKNKWDEKTITRQLPWPLATNYPRTKLGQSVTPVIELQRLCISPGPEEIRMYPLPGQRPCSAVVKSTKMASSLRHVDKVTHISTQGHGKPVERKRLNRRPKSAPTVTFIDDVRNEFFQEERKALDGNKSHGKPVPSKWNLENANANVGPCDRGALQAWDYTEDSFDLNESAAKYHPHESSNSVPAEEWGPTHESSLGGHDITASTHLSNDPDDFSSPVHESSRVHDSSHGHQSSDNESPRAIVPSHGYDSSQGYESSQSTSQVLDPSATHNDSTFISLRGAASCIPEASKKNFRPITIEDYLTGQQTEEQKRIREAVKPKFITEKERFQMKYGKKRATDEENDQAFQQWLALKQQDAKDEKLISKVQKMLNQVTGVNVEQKKETPTEQPGVSANEKAFEDWLAKKKKADVRRRRESERAREIDRCKVVRQGKTFDEWVKEKHRTKSTVRDSTRCENSRRSDLKRTEAQLVYDHWLKKKQQQELEALRSSRPLLRPNSAVGFAKHRGDGTIRTTRVQSAQARMKPR